MGSRLWEIRESYGNRSEENLTEDEKKAYKCGYEDGYEDAMEESGSAVGERHPMRYMGERGRMRSRR